MAQKWQGQIWTKGQWPMALGLKATARPATQEKESCSQQIHTVGEETLGTGALVQET